MMNALQFNQERNEATCVSNQRLTVSRHLDSQKRVCSYDKSHETTMKSNLIISQVMYI